MRWCVLVLVACSNGSSPGPAPVRDAAPPIDAPPIHALAPWPIGTTAAWRAIAGALPPEMLTGAVVMRKKQQIATCRADRAGAITCTFTLIARPGDRESSSQSPWPVLRFPLLTAAEAAAFDQAPPPDFAGRLDAVRAQLGDPPTPLIAVCDRENELGTEAASCDLPPPGDLTVWLGHGVFAVAHGRTYAGAIFTDDLACSGKAWRLRGFVDPDRTIVAGVVEVDDAACPAEPRAVRWR
jgi:hypothetical protein